MTKHKPFLDSLDFAIDSFGDFSQYYKIQWDLWTENSKLKEIAEQKLRISMQTYWEELCQKIQLSSFAGISRTIDWLKGMKLGINEENYLVFSSSFRGALESAGDIWCSFSTIPNLLVDHMVDIDLIFKGTYPEKSVLTAETLEKLLIHFGWGRKTKSKEPSIHKNRSNTAYIKCLDENDEFKLLDLYNELCHISHPAHYTVLGLFQEEDEKVSFKEDYNSQWINYLINKYSQSYCKIINNPINICLISLWCLNQFKIKSFHTPIANSFKFDMNPSWIELANKVEEMNL
jgi:hypothetical protein